jgi:hypothetical protein
MHGFSISTVSRDHAGRQMGFCWSGRHARGLSFAARSARSVIAGRGFPDFLEAAMNDNRGWKIVGLALTATFLLGLHSIPLAAAPTNVTTYHYDNERTGWNPNEKILTPGNVDLWFGLLHTVPSCDSSPLTGGFSPSRGLPVPDCIDDQVDAQPLIVTNQPIKNKGTHNVVYVATEANTIYAIDTDTYKILLQPNFGTPVPQSALPGQCFNNATHVGINSTPVIDAATGTMYVVVYSYENNSAIYRLHALKLDDLTDKVPPVTITASHKVTGRQKQVDFNPGTQRQRAALLLTNGNIYAAFASFCDFKADNSRGWLLGWKAGSLTPLAHNELTDTQNSDETPPPPPPKSKEPNLNNYFLSSIWMSGYGVAADAAGNLYFVTGNSDTKPAHNLQESAVKLSPDLSSVLDYFQPEDFASLDIDDSDFGSGGLLVLPDRSGSAARLAVAAGKDGRLFILDRDHMGALDHVDIGGCWCGPSYFKGSDGVGRVVTSGGHRLKVWKLQTSPVPLALEGISHADISDDYYDPGFFTVVSSNGIRDAVIWAVSRPASKNPEQLVLYAFDAAGGHLFSAGAGTWPKPSPTRSANPNTVPLVANGKVYIASYKQLAIFGLLSPLAVSAEGARIIEEPSLETAAAPPPPAFSGSIVYGTIESIDAERLVVELRTGRMLAIDLTDALREHLTVVPYVGEGVMVRGTFDARGTLRAQVMLRADHPAGWGPDQLD